MTETTYKIVRFKQHEENEVIETGLTLQEVMDHCNEEDSTGDGWFDGWTIDEEGDDA
jgi:hypothetical protein